MKLSKFSLLFIICFLSIAYYGQVSSALAISANTLEINSPDGLLDNVFDQFGNHYKLNELKVGASTSDSLGTNQKTSTLLCPSGYFNLYFETGSGMEGNTAIETARRNVICQVFSDISTFINSPLQSSGNTNRVNIWIRDINQIVSNSNISGALGFATAFYNVPQNATAGFGGIADNEIWKTIQNGTDSYVGVTSPLSTQGGINSSSGTFYHGMMTINFNNPGTNWNTNLGISASPSGLFDLYSIALHEVTHALGFASLINYDGSSKFGFGYNYYSRYDLFLKNNNTTQYLISNAGQSCTLYNYQFNLNPSILTPGCSLSPNPVNNGTPTDITNCGSAIKYVGSTNVPVYTPTCFELTSSLSHFEDQLYPNCASSANNNLYFAMSNGNSTGAAYTKRHLTPEERNVLCDLGYNTNSIYGLIANHNYFDYQTTNCAGINVAGINDGISPIGSYLFSGNVSSNINITGLLLNDYFGSYGAGPPSLAKFECLEDVTYGVAPLSVTSGFNNTPITFNSSAPGVHLLRYIPVSPSGIKGNITYVYVYVLNTSNCSPSACNMINNGGFENSNGCGPISIVATTPVIDCWKTLTATPDLFKRNCIPFPPQMTVPTPWTNPTTDTWNNGQNGNNNFLGLWSFEGYWNESTQTTLSASLLPNTNYVLSFWARVANNYGLTSNIPTFLEFAGSVAPVTPFNAWYSSTPPPLITLAAVQVPANNQWNHFSVVLNSTNVPLNFLSIINASYLNINLPNNATYILLDDVSLLPQTQSASLNLPNTFCINQTVTDLSSYLSSGASGGVFSGSGVNLSSGIYTFNAGLAGVGSHIITYDYTNGLGCPISLSAIVNVVNSNINVTASASPNNICSSGAVTLTGTGALTYVWQPGNISGGNVVVNPSASTTYVVTGTDVNGCIATANVAVIATPIPINLVVSNNIYCGSGSIITPSGANSYLLQPGNIISNGIPFVVNPSTPTIYTVYGTDINGCTGSAQVTINPSSSGGICANLHTSGTPITVLANTSFIAIAGVYIGYNFTCFGDIVIPNNTSTTFKNCTFMMGPGTSIKLGTKSAVGIDNSHLYGCTNMWQGIIMPGQIGAKLIMRNTLVEDAFWGVRVAAAGSTGSQNFPNTLDVSNCIFNANSTDIDYANTNTNQLTVAKTAFTSRCLSYDPPSAALPNITANFYTTDLANAPFVQPLDGLQAPLYGLYMYEFASVPGQGSQIDLKTVNIFDKHAVGIRTINFSNLKIEKQIFVEGMQGDKQLTPVSNVGILLFNSNYTPTATSPNNNFLISIGNIGNKGNKFDKLDYGIYANAPNLSAIRTDVKYNTFTAMKNTGIYYTGVPYTGSSTFLPAPHNIANNNFTDCKNTAITIINSTKTNMRIANNSINNPLNPAIEYKGIVISEISNPSTAQYLVSNNTINNVNKGIKVDNTYGVNVNNNTINLVPSTTSFFNFAQGITLKNCNVPIAKGNNITGLYTVSNIALDMGFNVSDCPKGQYTCNTIKNTLLGTMYNGQNVGSVVRQNTFNRHLIAIYLANNGFIDIQGSNTPTGAVDNQFFNIGATQYHTYAALSSIGPNSNFFVRNNLNFTMPNNSSDGTSVPIVITNVAAPSPYINECSNIFNFLQNSGGLSPLANAIANPGLFNATLVRENHTSKRQLYKELLNMTAVPNATLQAFKTANTSSSLGRFTMVDSTISNYFDGNTGALVQAQTFNTFTTANSVENYQKQFNTLYLQYLQTNSLNASGIAQVNTIAALCPYTDGTVVWQARAFAKLFNDSLEFYNTCENINLPTTASSSRMGMITDETTAVTELISGKLIPNPNDGNFTLLLDKEVDELSLKVFDITGKEVCNNAMTNTNNIQLNCVELKNGIYIVKVYNNGTYLQSHKLVIQK